MNYLLDTHALLWLLAGNKNISQRVKQILANPEDRKFVSVASFWEIAIKMTLGKLEIDYPIIDLPSLVTQKGLLLLLINQHHAVTVATLPLLHKDPFDRMLISQAKVDNLIIITRDDLIKQYDVLTVW